MAGPQGNYDAKLKVEVGELFPQSQIYQDLLSMSASAGED